MWEGEWGELGHADGGSPVQLVISSQRLSTVALMPEQHATPVPELTSFFLHLQLLLLTNQIPPFSLCLIPATECVATPAVRIEANNSPAGATLQHFSLFLHNWLAMFCGPSTSLLLPLQVDPATPLFPLSLCPCVLSLPHSLPFLLTPTTVVWQHIQAGKSK